MFLSVLVPLDRTSFAEQALPLALSVARRAKARLDLVEVHALYALEDITGDRMPFGPDRDAECKRQEQLYLDATAKWLTAVSPISVTTVVLPGSVVLPETVADSILERTNQGKADLIVMSTHGQGPLSRFGLGSVADQLIRRAWVPVVLVRPCEKAPDIVPEPVLDNILIPLDGSALAEQVLDSALDLAHLMEARCTLLRVVDSRSSSADGAPVVSADRAQADAEAYLERIALRVRKQGLQVRIRVAVSRRTVESILEEADAQANSLIALATHGRGGLKKLLLGSVADKLIRAAMSPTLVYRPTIEKFR